MSIKVLPPEVVAKIAAGEVVERPASVIKELVENSLDAGATQIEIEGKGGGVAFIRVNDNGAGIASDEVELVFQRYATSKISSANDLEKITSLGFRGEALPSIASVAEVSLHTRTPLEAIGSFIQLKGGMIRNKSSSGCPLGTSVTVRHLFREFPARLKFLRSTSTENLHINHLVTQYVLAFPEVEFKLVIDGRTVIQSPGNGKPRDALLAVYGPQVSREMLEIDSAELSSFPFAPSLTGFISPPSLSRSSRAYFSFFVNRRWVQSKLLTRAVEEAYQGLLMSGRYPIVVLNIRFSPENVDVNIHPTKREVKFRREKEVFQEVQKLIRQALLDKTPQAAPFPSPISKEQASGEQVTKVSAPSTIPPLEKTTPLSPLPLLRVLNQVRNAYIAAEGPEGMYLIDQHAAHERILFERLSKESKGLEIQGLLQPRLLELTPRQEEGLKEKAEFLAQYGFQLEHFGGRTYLLRSAPALLQDQDPAQGVLEILDFLAEEGKTHWKERIVTSLTCRAAIRAGQVLSQAEMESLVRQLEQTENPRTCPHGRPTMIHLPFPQLEREFGRF